VFVGRGTQRGVEKFQGEIEIDSRSTPKAILRQLDVSSLWRVLFLPRHLIVIYEPLADPWLLSTAFIASLLASGLLACCSDLSRTASQPATVINHICYLAAFVEMDRERASVLDTYSKRMQLEISRLKLVRIAIAATVTHLSG